MGSAGRQVHSMGWVADAFGNALGNSIVGAIQQSAADRQARETRAKVEQQSPELLGLYDKYVREGNSPDGFLKVVGDENVRVGLVQATQLSAKGEALVSDGVLPEDVWSHDYAPQNESAEIALVDGVEKPVREVDTFGLRALNTAGQLREGLVNLAPDIDYEAAATVVRLALLGPAGFALDHVTGKILEATVGDAVGVAVNKVSTGIVAGAYGSEFGDAEWLLDGFNRDVMDLSRFHHLNDPIGLAKIDKTINGMQQYQDSKASADFLLKTAIAAVGVAKGAGKGLESRAPTIGGGGTLDKLSSSEMRRIQNAANRSRQDIAVVGSRVNPNKALRPESDYDYVINANSKTRNSLSGSLPGAKNIQEGTPRNLDIFHGAVDPNRPHVIFHPEE